jgi:hypothetical protein
VDALLDRVARLTRRIAALTADADATVASTADLLASHDADQAASTERARRALWSAEGEAEADDTFDRPAPGGRPDARAALWPVSPGRTAAVAGGASPAVVERPPARSTAAPSLRVPPPPALRQVARARGAVDEDARARPAAPASPPAPSPAGAAWAWGGRRVGDPPAPHDTLSVVDILAERAAAADRARARPAAASPPLSPAARALASPRAPHWSPPALSPQSTPHWSPPAPLRSPRSGARALLASLSPPDAAAAAARGRAAPPPSLLSPPPSPAARRLSLDASPTSPAREAGGAVPAGSPCRGMPWSPPPPADRAEGGAGPAPARWLVNHLVDSPPSSPAAARVPTPESPAEGPASPASASPPPAATPASPPGSWSPGASWSPPSCAGTFSGSADDERDDAAADTSPASSAEAREARPAVPPLPPVPATASTPLFVIEESPRRRTTDDGCELMDSDGDADSLPPTPPSAKLAAAPAVVSLMATSATSGTSPSPPRPLAAGAAATLAAATLDADAAGAPRPHSPPGVAPGVADALADAALEALALEAGEPRPARGALQGAALRAAAAARVERWCGHADAHGERAIAAALAEDARDDAAGWRLTLADVSAAAAAAAAGGTGVV